MRCRDVHDVLDALEDGRLHRPDAAVAEELAHRGWIAPVLEGAAHRVAALREDAARLQARLREVAADPDARALVQSELAAARQRLFDAAEASDGAPTVDVDGVPHGLAWRGRELLDELRPRLHRAAELDVDDFVAELAALRILLRALARRAAEVAARLGVDGAVARLAGTGLAGLGDGELPTAETAWREAWSALVPLAGPEVAAACAEATALGGWRVAELVEQARSRRGQVDATTLPVTAVELATGAPPTRPIPGLGPLGAALLRLGDADPAEVTHLARRLDDERHRHHAALVHLGGPEGLPRYLALVDGLARVVPTQAHGLAAVLALLDAPADEILDDLRLAAECVTAERLGAGGLESLSLGAKLLLVAATEGGSALLPSAPPASAADAARAALRLPIPARPLFRALAPIHVELAHAEVATWMAAHPGHRSSYRG